ncbi:MAG: sugar transferase [Bacteroidales bacterium]|nr:sugar transferase [Bacteroidales bacterium]MBN2750635.1 sugar transferase [Bacteroidales bacterium]
MNNRSQIALYLTADVLGSALAWIAFNIYRKWIIEPQLFGEKLPLELDLRFVVGLIFVVAFWFMLFSVAGFYKDVFRRSRLKELGASIGITIIGVVLIFFLLLLDDYIATYRNYYQLLGSLFVLQFSLTYFPRLAVTSRTIRRIHQRKFWFPTLIVGNGTRAQKLYQELEAQEKSQGNRIVGYLTVNGNAAHNPFGGKVPYLGDAKQFPSIISTVKIDEVIVALEDTEPKELIRVINDLLAFDVAVKAIPSLYDHLTGRVKMSSIFGTPLFQISYELIPLWQCVVKQTMDYVFSFLALVTLSPLILFLAALIKLTTKGPIIHFQERVGKHGKPFMLYKFRSMYVDAESAGPALSSKRDPRVTKLGRFMRKTRLDELPNFVNVLLGDMSLVGPRPERQFFINQIVEKAPHYIHLQKVKPGITSWGQVKYGYAENVDQMVERLNYDLLYLENMSLFVDLKIIIYTLITVFRGRGV